MSKHLQAIFSLLPRGDIFPKQGQDSVMEKLFLGLAQSFDDFEDDVSAELADILPDQVGNYIEDWERVLGLPFPGQGTMTADERKNVVLALLTTSPESSRTFFEDIAAIFGYPITISRGVYHLFRAGSSVAGDPVNSPILNYIWEVSTTGIAGPDVGLEYVINKFKPAHTYVKYVYNP